MDKKALTETDIRTKFITPAIIAKWDVMTQVLEERYFTKGRGIVRGKMTARGQAKKADYILFYKPNLPLAIVEERTREIRRAGHGVSMSHMTKDKFERLEVALPPLAEQKRIVAKVDDLMALCDQLEAQQKERETLASRLLDAIVAELTAFRPPESTRAPARGHSTKSGRRRSSSAR